MTATATSSIRAQHFAIRDAPCCGRSPAPPRPQTLAGTPPASRSSTPCSRSTIPRRPNLPAHRLAQSFAGAAGLSGTQTVSIDSLDQGSGIYRTSLEVDGSEVASATSSSSEYPTCVKPFRVARPCPQRAVTGLSLDTTNLTDGDHEATVRVSDATEANTISYGPVSFSTTNSKLANYCQPDASLSVRSNFPTKPLRFGSSWTLRARLPGAKSWDVLLLQGHRNITVVASGHVSSDGQIAFKVPAGTNRVLRLAARPAGSREPYRCSSARALRVKPKVHLAISPEEVSNGRSVRLKGRLFGQGNTGRSIVIQARATGSRRWATVRVVRTGRQGRFGMRYGS